MSPPVLCYPANSSLGSVLLWMLAWHYLHDKTRKAAHIGKPSRETKRWCILFAFGHSEHQAGSASVHRICIDMLGGRFVYGG